MSEMLAKAKAEIDQLPRDARPRRSLSEPMTLDDALVGPCPYFEIEDGAVRIYWGGYDYDPTLNEIPDPLALLGLVSHLTGKAWPLMNADRIGMLIDAVCEAKGWNHHTGEMKQAKDE